jgi:hypothetical protein
VSRTYKDDIRQSRKRHPDAPFWKYRWWLKHGSQRSSAATRRFYNPIDRTKAKQALHHGREVPRKADLHWIYW